MGFLFDWAIDLRLNDDHIERRGVPPAPSGEMNVASVDGDQPRTKARSGIRPVFHVLVCRRQRNRGVPILRVLLSFSMMSLWESWVTLTWPIPVGWARVIPPTPMLAKTA